MSTRRFSRPQGILQCLAVVLVLPLAQAGCGPSHRPLESVRELVQRGRYQDARADIDLALQQSSGGLSWRLLAAEVAAGTGDVAACRDHLKLLPASLPPSAARDLTSVGQSLVRQGGLTAAEEAWRRGLVADPEAVSIQAEMAYLLGAEGRCFEAAPLLLAAVRRGEFTLHHLVLLGAADPVIDAPDLVAKALAAIPADPLPRLGEARTAIRRDDWSTARSILTAILERTPESGEAQGQMGRLLVATNDAGFPQWSARVPAAAEFHPEVWIARGQWALAHDNPEGAARCLWEAATRDSEHRVANFQLGQALVRLGRAKEAEPFLLRAERLQTLAQTVDEIYRHPDDPALRRTAAELAEKLGRLWEARGWIQTVLSGSPSPPKWASEAIARIEPRLASSPGRVVPGENPALAIDLRTHPLPSWNGGPATSPGAAAIAADLPALRFADRAGEAGLDFVYRARGPQDDGEMRMYETTGGGVAVLDFDADGEPDLYFTQGGSLAREAQPDGLTDRLFRLRAGSQPTRRAYVDVTLASGTRDRDYGQGVAAGDLDNDGFPDLYVGQFGTNRLLHNNGDGTFDDITALAGLGGDHWTTSCLIADLNGDGHPDLYDVNYVSREDAVRATCRHGQELQWCSPGAFAAEPDALWLSRGDGTFEEVTAPSGIDVPNGKGLGIIAADFDGSGRLSLFVANDAVPNFFFQNETAARGDRPRFTECAMERGLAVDADGLPQACMGVAAGDLDGDQRLDLFVTNFYDESNTLYFQRSGGLFADETRATGLREPSLKLLGFGTQSLDADLDGRLDLVVTNGHVLDLSASGVPFAMPPQLFWNRGSGGRFVEASRSAGAFFASPVRGRGLARLDWNRDGREDFAVSHIDAPAALLENTFETHNHFLAIRLVGLASPRDAIGATATLRAGETTWTCELTGGDGYQCTNERQLHFGLGSADRIESLTIRWPSGTTSVYHDLAVDRRCVAVEGADRLLRLPE